MPEQVARMVFEAGEIAQVASRLLKDSQGKKIWLWQGEMGAGKTTLIKEVCRQLGVTAHMSSPTFSIVHEYATQTGGLVYHFDFYRLKNVQEALDIGIEEYLDSGRYCMVEWPQQVTPLLESDYFNIELTPINDTTRSIQYEIHEREKENRI